MPRKTVKKSVKSVPLPPDLPLEESFSEPNVSRPPGKSLWVGAIVVGLAAVLWLNRSWFVAATVNGKPIWRAQLNSQLTNRFGKQTLEAMISEHLIAGAAREAKVSVTQVEVEAKEKEVLKKLGGDVNLEELLRFQGLTKADFDQQMQLQLTVEKILGKGLEITEADINDFIASNRAQLVATEEAQMRAEAKDALFNQKVGQKLQPWFEELKAKAKIIKFL